MKTLQFVEKMESQINLWVRDSLDAFDAPNASMWVLDKNNLAMKVTHDVDVYALLQNKHTIQELAKFRGDGFVVFACGWAASLDDVDEDTPPSRAPNKRRVRVVIGANKNGTASVIRFKDKPEETLIVADSARGELSDAVNKMYSKIKSAKRKKK